MSRGPLTEKIEIVRKKIFRTKFGVDWYAWPLRIWHKRKLGRLQGEEERLKRLKEQRDGRGEE